MAEFAANFLLNNDSINTEFNLSEGAQFDALFEIYASGTVWGSISGTLSNQTDLQAALDLKADKTELNTAIQNEAATRAENDTLLQNNINTLSQTVTANYNALDARIITNTGNISDINTTLSGYGNIVTHNVSEFATSAQGALADTALQPNDNISELVNDVGYITSASLPTDYVPETRTINGYALSSNITLNYTDVGALSASTTINDLTTIAQQNALNSGATTTNIGQITTNANNISDIQDLIPNQATSSNQLADKDFVNSSIATNTANFIGTFNSVAELEAYTGTLTNNDYAFVATTDAAGNTLYDRYKYNANTQEWLFEYELNNSSFTAVQWASINSGATSTNIGQITINSNNIANLQTNKQDVISDLTTIRSNALAGKNASDTIATYGNIVTHNVSEFATSSQGALADTALQPNDNISELTNDAGYITAASLPTVNNGRLTIQANGTTVGTFTANQAGNTTANIVVPDSATWGNITGTLSNQTDLQNALDAKQSTISDLSTIRSGASAGATALQPNDNITELVNNAGYITGITSSDVTTALGYTPYNATNPNGYITASALNGYATQTWVTNQNYVNGTTLATTLLDYVTNISLATTLADYQPLLVSGTNIKTLNGNSILGSGDLTLDGLPSQTGQSGKFLTTDGTDASWGVVKTHNLLEFKWSDHLLDDVSWLRADTFSWQSGDVYVTAYNHLVQDIQGITAETETIGSYTVTFYRATDGHKICLADQESAVLNIYNSTGIAWYYILDTTNTQFKLPRTKYGFEGLRGNVGDYIPQDVKLPNITTPDVIMSYYNNQTSWTSGAMSAYQPNNYGLQSGGGYNYTGPGNFSASRCSSVYSGNGTDTNIQERATQMYLYFYVGDYSQTAVEQTAGLNSELFNGKVDLPTGRSQSSVGLLVESYVNGTSWYRVYSDGWCEQGGYGTHISPYIVNLLKAFRDTNYTLLFSQFNAYNSVMAPNTKTTTSFKSGANSGTGQEFYWYACGYIS